MLIFYNQASRSKSFLTALTVFPHRTLSPLSLRAKVIFSKLKTHHSILLLKTLFQWLHKALTIYLSSLLWPTRSHVISSLFLPSPTGLPVSIPLAFCLFLQQSKLEAFSFTFPCCLSVWLILRSQFKCHLPEAFPN